jgi:hypothetical protein
MDQVKENISMSNTILSLGECAPDTLFATVLQQWSRKQMILAKCACSRRRRAGRDMGEQQGYVAAKARRRRAAHMTKTRAKDH